MMRGLGLVAVCLALVAISGCTKGTTQLTCASNLDCRAPGTRCDTGAGICVCATDEACGDGLFCNRAGVCQTFAGCQNNSECARKDGTYCDISTGQCLEGPALMLNSPCGLSSHCPYGTLCTNGSCVPSCFDDGDCPLGQVCFNDQCVSGNNICSHDSFCGYGQLCNENTVPGTCKDDHRGPYCDGCSVRTMANPNPCDHPRNFCLINNFETTGFRTFCGVDCSLQQECPNGYECGNVIILTQDVCGSQAECRCDPRSITFATSTCTVAAACDPRLPNGQPDPTSSGCRILGQNDCTHGVETSTAACQVLRGQRNGRCECSTDADCDDGTCVGGLCCGTVLHNDRTCVGDENRVSGFCTCATDSDCPHDVCFQGSCVITGMPCEPGADNCGSIPCVGGGCLIGANCAPLQGLSCSILTAQ